MVSLVLFDCKYCFILPPLGQLLVLKELIIEDFEGISCVDRKFYRNVSSATKPFQSLETLTFVGISEWKEWFTFEGECEGVVFARLRELHIIRCPKLIRDLPSYLLSLALLEIEDCQQLVTSLPRTRSR